ncbi:hypothetical protein MTO96_001034 [Rhipicephalus appendiculatus]
MACIQENEEVSAALSGPGIESAKNDSLFRATVALSEIRASPPYTHRADAKRNKGPVCFPRATLAGPRDVREGKPNQERKLAYLRID